MSRSWPLPDERYRLYDPDSVATPAVAVYPDLVRENIAAGLARCGGPTRMRPHVKTHKTRELVQLQLAAGITRHKCATLAEAEMLASAGVQDIVLAYPMVGPNIPRLIDLCRAFPQASIRPLIDHSLPLRQLAAAAVDARIVIEVLLDINVGMDRTGVALADAPALAKQIADSDGIAFAGLHVYDGQNTHPEPQARREAVHIAWRQALELAELLEHSGIAVERFVCGGSGSAPLWAEIGNQEPRIEVSPGTFFFNDAQYYDRYADLPMLPAAVVLTRVVSLPARGLATLDAGSKAVAADPPLATRVRLLGLANVEIVRQNEEHLVVRTPDAVHLAPGELLYAWPAHICPTVALQRELLAIEDGNVAARWPVVARDRRLTY